MKSDFLLSALSVCTILVLWQITSSWFIDDTFLPSPLSTLAATWELLLNGTLISSILISMRHILGGWILGSAVAIPVGLLVGSSRVTRAMVDPFIHCFRIVPALALVTLFIVWFGAGEVSKILLIAYATGFIVIVTRASGVASISTDKINAAKCLGATPVQVFRRCVIPASLPSIYVGMRLALASSFLVSVAAEMLAADRGPGDIIWASRLYFPVDWMFSAIVVLGLLGFGTDRAWRLIGRTLLKRYLRCSTAY
ncbi:ABC transporter permease [Mesobacterium pallidum]|uniref:ABC transporter permease n=1 Tax=Mesobacterium pallidum TaxID=2872037 RepID=UPI001EE209D0|nr:ABC transporter permease [Mesobacterium pallidum]